MSVQKTKTKSKKANPNPAARKAKTPLPSAKDRISLWKDYLRRYAALQFLFAIALFVFFIFLNIVLSLNQAKIFLLLSGLEIFIASLAAWIIYLFKRRRREDQEQPS